MNHRTTESTVFVNPRLRRGLQNGDSKEEEKKREKGHSTFVDEWLERTPAIGDEKVENVLLLLLLQETETPHVMRINLRIVGSK